ncbi:unnamed protein product [Trichogramma brassicae]|uniref:Uncharacterized protein n=1 Tax=Trichogramma brassicae TaxID=86971 RepID=A0A6H5I761_9HYME|nr:unnamed protein product [Trichogramma brassicae]
MSNEGQQDRKNSVHQALINHLKIVHSGQIWMNAITKTWMMKELGEESVREIYRSDPEILREIALARRTRFGNTAVSLLDVCTYPTNKAYRQLQLLNWESIVYNAERFGQFIRIGPTIKGCLTSALVRQFFDENRAKYLKEYF